MAAVRRGATRAGHAGPRVSILLNLSATIIFAVAAVTVTLLVHGGMRRQALVEAESKARILLDRNLATHAYFSQLMKPRLLVWTAPFRSADYFDPSWMSSTYAVRRIDGFFQTLNTAGYYLKDAAVSARSPDNEADEGERAFLEELNRDPKLEGRTVVRAIDGRPYFVVMRRGEVVEESCLLCHGDPALAPGDLVREYGPARSFGRSVGETASVVSLRVPLSSAYGQADRTAAVLSASLALLLGCLFAAQLVLARRLLVDPVAAIRDKALQIAGEESHLGEPIVLPRGRELRELARAFNTLSAGLRHSRDHLEERVTERTADLDGALERMRQENELRRSAEEALRKERDFAEGLVETAQAVVLVLDLEGRIVRFNRYLEALSGYRLEEVRGADWFSTFLPAREQARVRELFVRAVGGERTTGNVNVLRTKDGSERQIEWCDSVLRDADGCPAGLLSVGHDVTERVRVEEERRRMESQMLESQRLESLGVLAGGIAHDFNNLLMVVLANADILSRDVSPVSPARPSVEAIQRAARRAADLTSQMLAYAGKGTCQVGRVDLSEVVDEMAHLLDASVADGVRLERRLTRGLPDVEADVSQLQQVVLNLVANASEAIEEGAAGIVVVETGAEEYSAEYLRTSRLAEKRAAGPYVYLRVVDTGRGMDEEARSRLFDPFYSTKALGRGLGLSAVLGIVRVHGGAIMVESEPEAGSTVTVLLPALAAGSDTEGMVRA